MAYVSTNQKKSEKNIVKCMNTNYFYGRQTIDDKDIEEVSEILKSDWITQGPAGLKFEQALNKKFGTKFSTVVSSGTAALHLTALASGWHKNDIVITTPITFLATVNSILYAGATPFFVDIHPHYYTIDVSKLETELIKLYSRGKKVKSVLAVDLAGLPCDWKKLRELADYYKFSLINDFCHAPGSAIDDDITYAGKYADAVIMSFHPVKSFTTGEGGAVLTNNEDFDKKVKLLRTHGVIKAADLNKKEEVDPWYYEMTELGFNYRLTDFQSALGISQLKKLDRFIKKRIQIAEYYNQEFSNDERFIIPSKPENFKHSYHLYLLQINFEKLDVTKKELYYKLKEKNINLQVHYIPVHLQPYYQKKFKYRKGDFPEAEKYYSRVFSLPIYPGLTPKDIKYISQQIKQLAI